jgi:hypothetical protein
MNENRDGLDSRPVLTIDLESAVGRNYRHVYTNWSEVYTHDGRVRVPESLRV